MAMTVTQRDMDTAELVVLVDADGVYRWSSDRSRSECAAMLRRIADAMTIGDDAIAEAPCGNCNYPTPSVPRR